MRVSFCIPAHNEETLIGATVAALAAAARELRLDHEIVVACDACTDGTTAAAQRAGARTVEVDHRQISKTRNSAANATTGEPGDVLIFVDADTVVPVDSVRQALAAIAGGAVGGGAGLRFDGHVPLYGRILLPPLLWLFRVLRLTGGAFFFCTRRAFAAAGGWDESVFAGEEVDLARLMHKQGRFVIVREPVITSGRKLRTHTARDMFGVMGRAIIKPSLRRGREGLELW